MRWRWIMIAVGVVALVLIAPRADGATASPGMSASGLFAPPQPRLALERPILLPAAAPEARPAVDREKLGPVGQMLVPPEDRFQRDQWLAEWRKRIVCLINAKPIPVDRAVDEVLGGEGVRSSRGGPELRLLVTVDNQSDFPVKFQPEPDSSLWEVRLIDGLGTIGPRRVGVGLVRLPLRDKGEASDQTPNVHPLCAAMRLPLVVTWPGKPPAKSQAETKILETLQLAFVLHVWISPSSAPTGKYRTRVELSLPQRSVWAMGPAAPAEGEVPARPGNEGSEAP